MALTVRPFKHFAPPQTVSTWPAVTSHIRTLYDGLKQLRRGKMECNVVFTLTASVATSTFTDHRLSNQSVCVFDPMTANAATEEAAGTRYVLEANRGDGTWTVTHANNAQADRTFLVAIIG